MRVVRSAAHRKNRIDSRALARAPRATQMRMQRVRGPHFESLTMKSENKEALIAGVLNFATFPSFADATRAAIAFAVDAHDAGQPLSSLAVLLNKTDPANVTATLARRRYYCRSAFELPPDVLARLAAHDDKDSLLVLVAHADFASHDVLTLADMKESLK